MAKRFLQPDRFDIAWEYPQPAGTCLRQPIQQQQYNFPPPPIIGQKRSWSSVLTSVPPPPIIGQKRQFFTVLTRVPPTVGGVKKINPFNVVTNTNPPAVNVGEPTKEKTEVGFRLHIEIMFDHFNSQETKVCDQVEERR
jgi:hypothetical protein